ncbi:aldo/keto reductase [Planctomycetales bacterium]|nr:aldo/keto reductase [Planctomycetales bacterium]GHS96131.1 aldo/keto reductase [Planctomycetales bacterium]GHT04296.1 aldo/keto reductase [Planctomycetales bacterium]
MNHWRFGRTGLSVSTSGIGCIPIQRITFAESTRLLQAAADNGINFFDTARAYTTSEERLGVAFNDRRAAIFIATKTMARDRVGIIADLETSLKNLQTDYVDIYQLHNPPSVPRPGDEMYDTLIDLKAAGKIRFLGITQHDLTLTREAVVGGNYDTLQYPLSVLASDDELTLPALCARHDVGLLAMKAMAGGLLDDAKLAFTFLRRQFANVVPIWGVQRETELAEFLALEKDPPEYSAALAERARRYRAELAGSFCRACGYCLPCPVGIPIPTAARMSLLLRRMVAENFLTSEWREKMALIKDCRHCGQCSSRCPYHLDTPALLASEWEKYQTAISN